MKPLRLEDPHTQSRRHSLDARTWQSRKFNRDVAEILAADNTVLAKVWRVGDVSAMEIADVLIEAMIERQAREREEPGRPLTSQAPAANANANARPAGVKATPGAVTFAVEQGVDLRLVPATGAEGRVTKTDVINYLEGEHDEGEQEGGDA